MEELVQFNGDTYKKIDGLYESLGVSACGKIVNLRRGYLTQSDNMGYLYVSVKRSGGKRTFKGVHRLVAEYWIPNPLVKPWVNHKNGIKSDNRVENLEWTTISENIQHAFDTGLHKIKRGSEAWGWGKSLSEGTKLKMRDAKLGERHPRFNGWFLTPCGKFDSMDDAVKKNGATSANQVYRQCCPPRTGWGFKVKAGREPSWYKTLISVVDIKGTVIFENGVTRGLHLAYWRTPEGVFADIETAAQWNGVEVRDVKQLCLLGKNGWSVHRKVKKKSKKSEK